MARSTRRLIGSRIARARLALGASQENMADRFGVSRTLWSQYERGSAGVEAGDMEFLAEILEVPIEYFYEPGDVAARVEVARPPTLPDSGRASNVREHQGYAIKRSDRRRDIVINMPDGLTHFYVEVKRMEERLREVIAHVEAGKENRGQAHATEREVTALITAGLRQVGVDYEEEVVEHDALPSPEDYRWDSARGWVLKRASFTDETADQTG